MSPQLSIFHRFCCIIYWHVCPVFIFSNQHFIGLPLVLFPGTIPGIIVRARLSYLLWREMWPNHFILNLRLIPYLALLINWFHSQELFGALAPLMSWRLLRSGVAEVVYESYDDAVLAYGKYHGRNLDGKFEGYKIYYLSLSGRVPLMSQVSPKSTHWFGCPFHTNIQTYKHTNIHWWSHINIDYLMQIILNLISMCSLLYIFLNFITPLL